VTVVAVGAERAKEVLSRQMEERADEQVHLSQDSLALLRSFFLLLDKWDRQRNEQSDQAA